MFTDSNRDQFQPISHAPDHLLINQVLQIMAWVQHCRMLDHSEEMISGLNTQVQYYI